MSEQISEKERRQRLEDAATALKKEVEKKHKGKFRVSVLRGELRVSKLRD